MNTERESGLKLYSLGIVLEAKSRNSDEIKVWPSEELSLQKGDLAGKKITFDVSSMNQHGTEKKIKTEGGTAVTAKWIPDPCSNRETPPDVQPGETVKLFRYQDTPDYYWTTIFREPELRSLETVRYVFCNIPGSPHAAYDDDTSYWLEFSTHDKRIRLHTSDNDGEKAKYDVEINGKVGYIEIKDNCGNSALLESVKGNLTVTITNDYTFNGHNYTFNGNDFVWNGQNFTYNGQSFTTHTPKIELDGDVHTTGNESIDKDETIGGSLSQGGGSGGGGTATFGGSVNIAGDLDTAGNSNAGTRSGGPCPH